MQSIPLYADVVCADGLCGQSAAVIVDPKSLQVTHFAVKGRERPHPQWLVPVEQVVEMTQDSIRLRCSRKELAEMKPFTVTGYHQIELPRYAGGDTASPYYTPEIETYRVEREVVPKGELALHPGLRVEATDGPVGRVHELVSDAESGQITHFVLREGHPWGKKDVILPLSVVQSLGRDKVYLTVDKGTIGAMLAIPSRWRAGAAGIELVVLIADAPGVAHEALKALKASARKGDLQILNSAVMAKDAEGKARIDETADVSPRHGTLFGALTGGLLGLVGGPVGVVVGAAAGAATGRVAAGWIDMGFPDAYLKELQEGLQPGSSALVTLVGAEGADQVAAALGSFQGQVLRLELTDEMVEQLGAPPEEDTPQG